MMRISDLLADVGSGQEVARLDAELLLCHCLQQTRSYLYTWPEREIDARVCAEFQHKLEQRRKGVPVAYLTGAREFWSLTLEVNEHTLIPRPETETLVEWALELPLAATCHVADLGTGCGAIALALASERPTWRVVASDISSAALAVAQRNAQRLQLENVQTLVSDWAQALAGQTFALLVSNPPYIAAGDAHLSRGDLRFEPNTALCDGGDGLSAIRRIVEAAPHHLEAAGWLLLEHGYDQASAVRALLLAAGFSDVASRRDLAGQERITGGRWHAQ